MADLFLSYAREDKECAALLAQALSSRGWTVWWDREIPVGQSFSEVIERELDRTKCVIVLWSQHSLDSDWVQNEAAEAARKKMLVPVRIEDVRPPLEFRRLQTADVFEWRQGFQSPQFDACIASIEVLVGNTAAHPLPSGSYRSAPVVPPQAFPPIAPPPPPRPPGATARPYQSPYPAQQTPQRTIPNYLVPAILVTIGCCLPFGIVAIIYAAQVNTKLGTGDERGALQASASAKTWCWVAFWTGLVVGILWFIGLASSGSL